MQRFAKCAKTFPLADISRGGNLRGGQLFGVVLVNIHHHLFNFISLPAAGGRVTRWWGAKGQQGHPKGREYPAQAQLIRGIGLVEAKRAVKLL